MKNRIIALWERYNQFIRFMIVGASNTIISYLIYIAVLVILRSYEVKWDYIAGNIIAFLLSVLWSFIWNHLFVFKKQAGQQRNLWTALLKTYLSYGFSEFVLNNLLSVLWVEIIGVNKYIAPIINLVITVPLNYIMNKFWAFKTKEKR